MKTRFCCCLAMVAALALPAQAAGLREMGAEDLRYSVASGRSLNFGRVADIVASQVEGRLIDAAAYESDDGRVYFRLLIMRPDGRVGSVVVNGQTGRLLGRGSQIAQAVRTAGRAGDRAAGNAQGGNPMAQGGNPNAGGGNPNAGGGNPNAGGGNSNAGGGNSNAGGGGGNSGSSGGGSGGGGGGSGGGGNSGNGGGNGN